MSSGRSIVIEELRTRLDCLEAERVGLRTTLPFGVAEIDDRLPGGGLLLGALHEVSGGEGDMAYGAAAALFVAGVLARLSGPVLWCLMRPDLFAPALASVGLHPDRVIYVEAGDGRTVLLVMEEGLRIRGLAGVVGETDRLDLTASRRLHLAAERSGVVAFAVRRWRSRAAADKAGHSAAVTRWRITAAASVPLRTPGIGRARWTLDLLRCRNGIPSTWTVEACDAEGRLAASRIPRPADLADRPAAAGARGRLAAG